MRLSHLALILAAVACLAAAPPKPKVKVGAIHTLAPDSTLKLGVRVFASNLRATDSLRYSYYRNDTTLRTRRVLATVQADSFFTPAPAYGQTATFKGCAQIIGFPVTLTCWTWSYTRPAVSPTIDSVQQIVLRPMLGRLAADSAGRCASWQAAHPTSSPWITENAEAVSACMAHDSAGMLRPVVWRFCSFAVLADGRRIMTENSKDLAYCQAQYTNWLAEGPA